MRSRRRKRRRTMSQLAVWGQREGRATVHPVGKIDGELKNSDCASGKFRTVLVSD